MPPAKKFLPKTSGVCSNQSHARQPQRRPRALDKETMDPARPNDPDPSDPFSLERADRAIFETIEIATEGEDCDGMRAQTARAAHESQRVKNVKVDVGHERVVVTFDARKRHPP